MGGQPFGLGGVPVGQCPHAVGADRDSAGQIPLFRCGGGVAGNSICLGLDGPPAVVQDAGVVGDEVAGDSAAIAHAQPIQPLHFLHEALLHPGELAALGTGQCAREGGREMRTDDEFPFQYLHRQVLLQHQFEEDGSPHHQRLVPETGGQFHPGRIGQQVGLRPFEEHHHLRGGGPVPGSVDLVP